MKKTGAIIVAGGIGKRLGKNQPKGLIKIGKKPMFLYSLSVLQSLKNEIGPIVLVTPIGWGEKFASEIKKAKLEEPYAIVDGGSRRQDSVRFGLLAMPEDVEYVMIHDAARPFITPRQIKNLIDLLHKDGAATIALKVRDTLKLGFENNDTVYLDKAINRENLWALGTPQGFKLSEIIKAHERAQRRGMEVSDDTSLLPASKKVSVLEADILNFKITYSSDIEIAESLFPLWEKRRKKER